MVVESGLGMGRVGTRKGACEGLQRMEENWKRKREREKEDRRNGKAR